MCMTSAAGDLDRDECILVSDFEKKKDFKFSTQRLVLLLDLLIKPDKK